MKTGVFLSQWGKINPFNKQIQNKYTKKNSEKEISVAYMAVYL